MSVWIDLWVQKSKAEQFAVFHNPDHFLFMLTCGPGKITILTLFLKYVLFWKNWNWWISNVTFGICKSGCWLEGRPLRQTSTVLGRGRGRAWGRGGRREGRRRGGGRGRAGRRSGRGGGRRQGSGREKGTTAADNLLSKKQSQTSTSCFVIILKDVRSFPHTALLFEQMQAVDPFNQPRPMLISVTLSDCWY